MLCLHVLAIKSIFSTCLVSNNVAWMCPEGRVHCKKYHFNTLAYSVPAFFVSVRKLYRWLRVYDLKDGSFAKRFQMLKK